MKLSERSLKRKGLTNAAATCCLLVLTAGSLCWASPARPEPQGSMPAGNQAETQPPQPGQLPPDANAPRENKSGTQVVTNLPDTVSAPPLTTADKFDYRVVQTFGLRGVFSAAVSASIGQGAGSPKEWGGGVQGYAERFGSGFAGNLSRQTFEFVLEEALREDPRYFPSEDKRLKARTLNALKQVVATKTDAGNSTFAYARMISSFGAAQFVNVWQPASTGSVGDGFKRGLYGLGGDFAWNMIQEFFPFTRPHSIRHRPQTQNP